MFKCEHYKEKMDMAGLLLLLIRAFVGLIFILHGVSKAADISSFAGFLDMAAMPIPMVIAAAISYFEIIAGALLILGIFTKVVGILFAIELAAIILISFFNSKINLAGISLEYNLLLFLMAIYLSATYKQTCNICCLLKK